MANKQINELTEKSTMLADDDLILVYDSEEAGSEKTKKVAISNHISLVDSVITVYVDPAGSDSTGDGTPGNPWATPNKALDWATKKHFGASGQIYIQMNDGTYNNLNTLYIYNSLYQKIQILGNSSTPANVVLNFANGQHGFYARNGGSIFLNGLKIVGGGTKDHTATYTDNGSHMQIYNCIVTNWQYALSTAICGSAHVNGCDINNNDSGILANSLSNVFVNGSTITNNTADGARAIRAGRIYVYSSTISSNGTNTSSDFNGSVYVE